MPARLGAVFAALIMAALLAGCGSDSDAESAIAEDRKAAPSAAFRPNDALLNESDIPGFAEVESSPGDGICGFRLVERAANGGRATFQSLEEVALVEQLVLFFDGDADDSLNAFVSAVEGCESGTTGDYTLTYAIVPVTGVTADQVVGVEAVSTKGDPAIASLTIVARDGEEAVSVAAVTTSGEPDALATRTVNAAITRLRSARAAAG